MDLPLAFPSIIHAYWILATTSVLLTLTPTWVPVPAAFRSVFSGTCMLCMLVNLFISIYCLVPPLLILGVIPPPLQRDAVRLSAARGKLWAIKPKTLGSLGVRDLL